MPPEPTAANTDRTADIRAWRRAFDAHRAAADAAINAVSALNRLSILPYPHVAVEAANAIAIAADAADAAAAYHAAAYHAAAYHAAADEPDQAAETDTTESTP